MERMIRVVALLALAGAAVLPWSASPVAACSCVPGSMDPGNLTYADTVFAGTVVHIEEWDRRNSSAVPIEVKMTVDHVWLGEVTPLMTLKTSPSGASCGYTFQGGGRYLVYARGSDVSLCSATQPYGSGPVAAIEAAVGPGRAVVQPTNGTGGPTPMGDISGSQSPATSGAASTSDLVVALAVTALLCAGAMTLSRRR